MKLSNVVVVGNLKTVDVVTVFKGSSLLLEESEIKIMAKVHTVNQLCIPYHCIL